MREIYPTRKSCRSEREFLKIIFKASHIIKHLRKRATPITHVADDGSLLKGAHTVDLSGIMFHLNRLLGLKIDAERLNNFRVGTLSGNVHRACIFFRELRREGNFLILLDFNFILPSMS